MIGSYRSKACATVIGTASVLTGCVSQPARLLKGLRSPHAWMAEVGPDAAVGTLAGALLWFVALWVAFGLSATAVSLLPGRLGLAGHAVAGWVTPAALRRIVVAAAGTSILVSPVTAFADSPAGGSATAARPSTGRIVPSAAALELPMDQPSSQPGSSTRDNHQAGATPSAHPSGSPSLGSTAPPMPPLGWPTDPTFPTSHSADTPKPASPRPPESDGDHVTVHHGDSLWSIAANRLGKRSSASDIQAEWPRWYAVNRQLIGADPNLLRPGASLLAPQPALLDTDR
ncbi:MAG: hypothetical protein QOI26_177 [Pseudonocardiales bacterium]|nr:hypothetical protein [Pseudonocardiales bacterium]